jgi:hypothetical protein
MSRAATDDVFAARLFGKDKDQAKAAVGLYDLTPGEVAMLLQYQSREELLADWQQLQKAKKRSFLQTGRSFLMLIYGGAFLLLITALGSPDWWTVPRQQRLLIFVCAVVTTVVVGILLALWSRDVYESQPPQKRNEMLTFGVIFFLIPGVLVLALLSEVQYHFMAKLFLVLIFTSLPAAMYFIFVEKKAQPKWEEFKHDLKLLEPHEKEWREMLDTYKIRGVAIYGSAAASGQANAESALLQPPFPILLNTFMVGLGWVLVLFGGPGVSSPFWSGLTQPFAFAFLGAYSFSVQMLFHRYLQADLKYTAYTHASVRIATTLVWAYLLNLIPGDYAVTGSPGMQIQFASILAFAIGIFPEIGIQFIFQALGAALGKGLPIWKRDDSLRKLTGINIWTEARLLEEGIESIQNLVTADVLGLMLATNFPTERIIDWVDQGSLYLHTEGATTMEEPGQEKANSSMGALIAALQTHGITKASDLTCSQETLLAGPSAPDEKLTPEEWQCQVLTLVDTLMNAPNMMYVCRWRLHFRNEEREEDDNPVTASAGATAGG